MEALLVMAVCVVLPVGLVALVGLFSELRSLRAEVRRLDRRVGFLERARRRSVEAPAPAGATAAADERAESPGEAQPPTPAPARTASGTERTEPAAEGPAEPGQPSAEASTPADRRASRRPGAAPSDRPAAPEPVDKPEPQLEPVMADAASSEEPPALSRVPDTLSDLSQAADDAWSGGLEALLGLRLFVWLGAVALALAGAFLVKYGIDQGWLVPAVRVTLGGLLGLALVGAGERLQATADTVAAAASASGIAVLLATLLAATNLYAMWPPLVGFGLMAIVSGLGVALSLRHGQLVAVVGLLGGFLTPALVSGGLEPRTAPLLGYLLLVQLAVLAVARRRGWWPLVALTMAGAGMWVLLLLATTSIERSALSLDVFLVATAAAALAVSWRSGAEDGRARAPRAVVALALQGPLSLQLLVTAVSGYTWREYGFVALLGLTGVLLARLDEARFGWLAWASAMGTAALLLLDGLGVLFGSADGLVDLQRTVGAFGALYALAAYAALWGAERPRRWSVLGAAAAVGGYLLWLLPTAAPDLLVAAVRWLGGASAENVTLPSGAVALSVALALAAAAAGIAWRRGRETTGRRLMAPLLAAVVGFTAWGLLLALDGWWRPIGWSLELVLLGWLATRLELRTLLRLGWGLLGLTLVALVTPNVVGYPLARWPVVNQLLYGYGVPIAAFVAAAHLVRLPAEERLGPALGGSAAFLGWLLVTLQVRQLFSPGDLVEASLTLTEVASYELAWLLYALGLLVVGRARDEAMARMAGRAVSVFALLYAALALGFVWNPLREPLAVGSWPVLNLLLYVYGLPALLMATVASELGRADDDPELARGVKATALTMVFLLVTLEVRQLFSPDDLTAVPLSLTEVASYDVAWLLYALGLLVDGGRRDDDLVRVAGRVVALLGVAYAAVVLALAWNPLLRHVPVGATIVVNRLLYVYGLPAVLIGLIARELGTRLGERLLSRLLGVAALALTFTLVTLEVRQAFHGTYLDVGLMRSAESYSYSLAWVLLGLALLVVGIIRGTQSARWSSLAVMMLAVGKVFLYDMAALGDLYRVLSFLGLGLSLLLLGWLYQRFVFVEGGGGG